MRTMSGQDYYDFMSDIHKSISPKVYFEVGTHDGPSLRLANCHCVAVDPEFIIKRDVIGAKKSLMLFQQPSDDFFQDPIFPKLKWKIDFAFLDGMHLYEFLLRDFMNTEKHVAKNAVVALHDCVPFSAEIATRPRNTKSWTGDVWKVVPILKKYRPDLSVKIYDAAPTGLVIIENMDPKNTVLQKNYDKIIKEFDEINNVEGNRRCL